MNRIGFDYQYNQYSNWVNSAQTKMVKYQQELSTGKRLNTLSDDPVASSSSLVTRALRSGLNQYTENLKTAKDSLNSAAATFGDVKDLMSQANTLALQASNATADSNTQKAISNQVEALQKRLLDLSNSRGPNGEYMFAGQSNGSAAYSVSGGVMNYTGDNNAINVETGPGQTLQVNSTQASTLLTGAYQALEQFRVNLAGNNPGAISSQSVKDIQSSMDAINLERGKLGSSASYAEALQTQHKRRSDELTSTISDLEDADMATSITNYQRAQTAYQAALTSVSTAQKLSLMDYIR